MSSTKTQVPFARAAIIGTGLIGGSFALALRKYFPNIPVVGFDRPEIASRALARGAIQEVATSIEDAVRDADLIYLAAPIRGILEVMPRIAEHAKPGALVTDAGSTKSLICREGAKLFARGAHFLGGHPIAGKENSGIEYADAELFRNCPYALIAQESDTDRRVAAFAEILAAVGATPAWCDAETHDWALGIVSHLPQMLAVALAGVVRDEADETGLPLTLAGPGARDMLRLAGSPFPLWRDIAHTNKENISRALDRMTQAIEHLRVNLTSKELEQEFRVANDVYKRLLRKD
ncbi:MAG TPA: prephenate dehydrogenase/arogenate dehydrogenase family protein [Candidatus Acidoferrales bacterium]